MHWLDFFHLGAALGWFKNLDMNDFLEDNELNYNYYDLDVYNKVPTSDICIGRTNNTNKRGKD